MVTLRCTQRLLKQLDTKPADTAPPTTALGDWYANIIPTRAGDFILCASERTLLGVLVPAMLLVPVVHMMFVARVNDLLKRINVPHAWVKQEVYAMGEMGIGRTASRSVLASMNDMTNMVQYAIAAGVESGKLDIATIEVDLSQLLHKRKHEDYQRPATLALDLLTAHYGQTSTAC